MLSTLDSRLTQIPVVVQVLVEWCRPSSTLLRATLLVALVIGLGRL